ncbi:MAG: hypothetical protein RSF79_07875 [Janthinobacterium sp.]|uniref:hypothetical protein n=1 Tax=Janthinobacterium sp. FT68W TaxID=2654255 RepID=UPI0012653582|nr:hypothetical protein [Janthinobacterium sp. FT68W]KAB8052676.1 hypothetical protein GCN78_08835 [Janthinobacterium sp. FT68W]
MNFSKSIRTASTVLGTAGVYAFLIASLCSMFFEMTSDTALAWIGGPMFVVFSILGRIFLPDSLRKANVID